MLLSIGKKYHPLNRALASIALIGAIVCLPELYYSRAHLHYFYGVVIAHWHPANGLSQENHSKKAPVAEHTHALSDLFNFWHVTKSQGTPVDHVQPMLFLAVQNEIIPDDYLLPDSTTPRAPVGRSPPVSIS